MKPSIKYCLLTIVITLISLDNLIAQVDSLAVYRVTLTDGTELSGKIISEADTSIVLTTPAGIDININKSLISEREMLSGFWENGQYVRIDPNRTRLFFSPTGRMLHQGEGYIADYELFFPFISVGATDFLTLSFGMFLLFGGEGQIYYFAPRVGIIQNENFALSGGVFYMSANDDSFGVLYGVSSYGDLRNSFTIGMGYGFSNGQLAKAPFILLGGETQVSNSIKLLTENYLMPDAESGIISFGLRFFGDYLSADLGLLFPLGSDGTVGIPWVGFCYIF